VAFAVGLDVVAVSIGIVAPRLAIGASVRLGVAFAGSEIAMQVIGYELGASAGQMLGEIAAYIGFFLLALIGALMIWVHLATTPKRDLIPPAEPDC
jgi:putative Mn2+ efflux pump MntP